jgi:pyruvate/2-oxoglutarate dehydrogenase complex dihydrolipoamide dehydrogenase (E3) component
LERLQVTVKLKKKATVKAINKFAPDITVLAVGSTEAFPDIPGIHGENVITCRQVLSGEREIGDKVVVIGGGSIGCETADFLAEKGKSLLVVFPEEAPMTIGVVDKSIRKPLLERLVKNKVKVVAGVKQFQEINKEGVRLIDREGNGLFLEADNIVLATGAKPNKTLAQSLKGKVPELFEVGDCIEPRRLLEAIHDGAEVGLQI